MRLLVLTRSDKHRGPDGGYCVAGIDMETSRWIRLIGPHFKFKIADVEAIYDNGNMCEPFDVIDVDAEKVDDDMIRRCNVEGWGENCNEQYSDNMLLIQPENYMVHGKFRFVEKKTIDDLLRMNVVDNSEFIFSNGNRRLSIHEAEQNNRSLVLVKADDLELYPMPRTREDGSVDGYQAHYRARFTYNGTVYEDISVTDPDYEAELTDFGGLYFGETYLVLSVGGEFHDFHYKLIAKIFEVVYTIENNSLNIFHAFRDCRYLQRYDNIKHALYDDLVNEGMEQCALCQRRYDQEDTEE